ncbi:hypothetical protein L2E82_15147 [Cichorium intybus]|uniref:Uncharacterized protein n=1 Tax=Cichorium intybus TaxID=13427 RepID=A0ACB9F2D7_CICIN|nr:hypothetical protein L2E82_15147 [Cichorium intybus]
MDRNRESTALLDLALINCRRIGSHDCDGPSSPMDCFEFNKREKKDANIRTRMKRHKSFCTSIHLISLHSHGPSLRLRKAEWRSSFMLRWSRSNEGFDFTTKYLRVFVILELLIKMTSKEPMRSFSKLYDYLVDGLLNKEVEKNKHDFTMMNLHADEISSAISLATLDITCVLFRQLVISSNFVEIEPLKEVEKVQVMVYYESLCPSLMLQRKVERQ